MDRARGRIPDTRAIEHCVDHDIQQWAAMNREAQPVIPKAREERAMDACMGVAEAVAARRESQCIKTSNLRPKMGGLVADEIQELPCPCGGQCKACKMRARLLAVMEPLPLKERMHVGPEVWLNCKYPELAKECVRTWQAIQRSPGLSPKRQRFMSEKDLNAWAQRKLEDICDRSNAIPGLGPWWVR